MLERLIELDLTFDEATFISKVDNIFIMLLSAFMLNDLDKVRHFISDNLEKEYDELLIKLKEQNQMQVYEMPNVKSTSIIDVQITDDKYFIKVKLISRYIKYIIDISTGNPITEVDSNRKEYINYLTFEKNRNVKEQSIARSCPTCGANISVNTNGKCKFCGTFYNQEDFDWILTDAETIEE